MHAERAAPTLTQIIGDQAAVEELQLKGDHTPDNKYVVYE